MILNGGTYLWFERIIWEHENMNMRTDPTDVILEKIITKSESYSNCGGRATAAEYPLSDLQDIYMYRIYLV